MKKGFEMNFIRVTGSKLILLQDHMHILYYCMEFLLVTGRCRDSFVFTLLLYNILLPINHYIGNNTTKCHSRSMSDNRDLTETFHQKISSHYKVIASAF